MVNGGRVSSWACINFSRTVQDGAARSFCHELALMCQVSGMVCVSQNFNIFSFVLFALHIFCFRILHLNLCCPHAMRGLNMLKEH